MKTLRLDDEKYGGDYLDFTPADDGDGGAYIEIFQKRHFGVLEAEFQGSILLTSDQLIRLAEKALRIARKVANAG